MFGVQHFLCLTIWVNMYCNLRLLGISALPATTSAPHTVHIVSFVQPSRAESESGNISDNALESSQPSVTLPPLNGRHESQLELGMDNNIPTTSATAVARTPAEDRPNQTDDLLVAHRNTLDDIDDIFGHNEQHEPPTVLVNGSNPYASLMWSRMKQSIPVLESVRHLLNTVRDGAVNQTVHAARQHHQLVNIMTGGIADQMSAANESSAIETEADREIANESTEFKLLDFVGSIVGMVWGFIGNIQRAFAASSGNALASSSSSSSSLDGQ